LAPASQGRANTNAPYVTKNAELARAHGAQIARTGHVIAMNMRTAVRVLKIQGPCNYDTLLRAYKKLKRHRGSTERAQQIEAAMDYLQCNLPAWALHTPSAELMQHKERAKTAKLATDEERKEFEDWLDSTFDYYELHKSRYEIFEFLSVYAEYHAKVERELRNSRRKNRRKPGTRAHRRTLHSRGCRAISIRRFVRDHLVLASFCWRPTSTRDLPKCTARRSTTCCADTARTFCWLNCLERPTGDSASSGAFVMLP